MDFAWAGPPDRAFTAPIRPKIYVETTWQERTKPLIKCKWRAGPRVSARFCALSSKIGGQESFPIRHPLDLSEGTARTSMLCDGGARPSDFGWSPVRDCRRPSHRARA